MHEYGLIKPTTLSLFLRTKRLHEAEGSAAAPPSVPSAHLLGLSLQIMEFSNTPRQLRDPGQFLLQKNYQSSLMLGTTLDRLSDCGILASCGNSVAQLTQADGILAN